MKPLTFTELEEQARKLVHSLGITLWVRDGRIWQHGPGEEIRAPEQLTPSHGYETHAAKEAAP